MTEHEYVRSIANCQQRHGPSGKNYKGFGRETAVWPHGRRNRDRGDGQ